MSIIGLIVVLASLTIVISTLVHGGKTDRDPRPPKFRPKSK